MFPQVSNPLCKPQLKPPPGGVPGGGSKLFESDWLELPVGDDAGLGDGIFAFRVGLKRRRRIQGQLVGVRTVFHIVVEHLFEGDFAAGVGGHAAHGFWPRWMLEGGLQSPLFATTAMPLLPWA